MRILFWAATVAIGMVGGWLLVSAGGDGPPAAHSPPSIPDEERTVAPAGAAPSAATPLARSEPTESADEGALEAPIEAESLAALLERFPVKEYPAGNGMIVGRVTDEYGAPVEGVGIDLVVHGATPGASPKGLEQRSVLDFALEEIDQYHYDIAYLRHAFSDAEGNFRFEELDPASKYHVHAGLDNEHAVFFEGATQQLVPDVVEEGVVGGTPIRARAFRASRVTFEVVDGRGEPIPAGFIQMIGVIDGEQQRKTRGFDTVRREVLVPLALSQVSVGSVWRGTSEPQSLSLTAGESTTAHFVVEENPSITVDLKGAEDPLDRIGLTATIVDLSAVDEIPESWDDWTYRGSRIDLEPGSRRRSMVSAGSHVVLLSRHSVVLTQQYVDVVSGNTTVSLTVSPLDRTSLAMVSVRDTDGFAIDDVGFRVTMNYSDDQGTRIDSSHVESSAFGRGRFALYWDERENHWRDNPEVRLTGLSLTVTSREYGTATIPIAFGTSGEFEVVFEAPARVTLQFENYLGHDLQGRVRLAVVDEHQQWSSHHPVDPLGFVRFGPVAPGPLLVRVDPIDGWRIRAEPLEYALVPGENIFTVPLPEFYTVRVRFPDATPGATVWLQTPSDSQYRDSQYRPAAEVDLDHVAEFRDLVRGTYFISLVPSTGGMQIFVPTEGEITFAETKMNALEVTIYDDQGWLVQAGFRAGDFIVSVDGATFDGLRELQFATMRAMGEGAGVIEVERDGSMITVPIPPDGSPSYAEFGGELRPAIRGGSR